MSMCLIPSAWGERKKGKQERSDKWRKREGGNGEWEKLNLLRLFSL